MKTIIYQVLPRLWGKKRENQVEDGTYLQNGSGKFKDIDQESIDYFKWLGVTHIWLTGVIRHSCADETANQDYTSHSQFVKGKAGSPYAINNYYDVNPYLADNQSNRIEEFKSLIDRIHQNGLKVIIDFVPNHVGRDYIGLQNDMIYLQGGRKDGCDDEENIVVNDLGNNDDSSQHFMPNNDFYYYPGEELKLPIPEAQTYYEYPAKASGNCFTAHPGVNDWYETIKINYCNFYTKTWDKMLSILKYWVDMGVDGFRCDMVELVPKEFFTWAIAKVKRYRSDIIFIAEVYQKELYKQYIKEVGFDYLYDKSGLYDSLFEIIRYNQSCKKITENWQFLNDCQDNMLNFLENHDELRFASDFFAGDKLNVCLPALSVSALLNNSAFMIYAGEELAERGMDKEGFSGRDGRTSIFDWCSPDSLGKLYDIIQKKEYINLLDKLSNNQLDKHIDKISNNQLDKLIDKELNKKYDKTVCSTEKNAEYEFFIKFTSIIRTAAFDKAFTDGLFYDLCYCNGSENGFCQHSHFAFLRNNENECRLVVANFSNQRAEMSLFIPDAAFKYFDIEDKNLRLGDENNCISLSRVEGGYKTPYFIINQYDVLIINI